MSCEHADEDLGVGIYESFAEWITVEVLYYDDVAVLKAADLSEDADLVNYYVDNLEFIDASEHSAATPMYDFACRFLCQETSTLQERRTSFFEHFNPDEEV